MSKVKNIILILLLLYSCSPSLTPTVKPKKSDRPKTDIVLMILILGTVVIWSDELGFHHN